jgi:enoyl-[acyl-carrier-protein] reductase (NADH)
LAPTPELAEGMVKKIPLRRTGEKHELANLAAYLISDYAAYINGEVVTIDGGEWLQGAGEFNTLVDLPDEMWDKLAELTRKGK